jgi:hypothetical protein
MMWQYSLFLITLLITKVVLGVLTVGAVSLTEWHLVLGL